MSERNLNSMWGNIRRISLFGIARIERFGPGSLMSYQSRCPPGRNTLVTSRATDLRISASRIELKTVNVTTMSNVSSANGRLRASAWAAPFPTPAA